MNGKIITGIVLLCLGVVLVAVLCGLGGYAKGALHRGILSRLVYDLPDGYKNDPNYYQCYHDTVASFDDEYYLWNLTNLESVLAGGRPNFNLTGPYSYVEWYCEYDHKIDKEAGLLTYKRWSDGYHYLRDSSISDDDVLITNVNPGYLALLSAVGGDDSSIASALVPTALKTVISTIQSSVEEVWLSQFSTVLSGVNVVVSFGLFAGDLALSGATATSFFDPSYVTSGYSLEGFTTWSFDAYSLSTETEALLFATYTNATKHFGFVQLDVTEIAAAYNVSESTAQVLLAYSYGYIYATLLPITGNQWANGAASTYYPGWEIGIPTSTNMSSSAILNLLSSEGVCSLVNTTTFETTWAVAYAAQDVSLVPCSGVNLTDTQKELVLAYIYSFTNAVVVPQLESSLNFSDWADFGYAQWGGLVLGETLGNSTYEPEIAANYMTLTVAEAKDLLNGTYGLFQLANLQLLSSLADAGNTAQIFVYWPAFRSSVIRLFAFQNYINFFLVPQAIVPILTPILENGGGLFTTRTVREWLFTAEDPLLAFLGQDADVSLVGNTSISRADSETANETEYRVYTGDNDLYWSLMPTNDGEELPIWRGNVTVNGYNGTQLLPFGYVDKPSEWEKHPLVFYHHLITRPIPFQNLGKDKWDGIDVRYLTYSDDALANETTNPVNYAYYATYAGAINKTSASPNIPVFLTTPNFYSADEYYYENIDFTDNIWAPSYDRTDKFSRHRLALFILVEPTLGSSVWGNLPIQANFQFNKGNLFYTNIVDTAYAPIYWNAIGDKATSHDLKDIKSSLYANDRAWKALVGVGAGVGGSLIIVGAVLIAHYKKHENELKDMS